MREQTLTEKKKNYPVILMATWNTIVRYEIENYLLSSLATYGNNDIFGLKLEIPVINSGNFHNAKPAARNIFVVSQSHWLALKKPSKNTIKQIEHRLK